jgi:hypothetical protein
MTIRVNQRAYDHARKLIADGLYVVDERDSWSEHRPTTGRENTFIAEHGLTAYARWHLGINDEHPEDTKGRYVFPYGDFERVHRCAVLSAEVRAGQYKHHDIQTTIAHLHGQMDALAKSPKEG